MSMENFNTGMDKAAYTGWIHILYTHTLTFNLHKHKIIHHRY